MHKTKEIDMLNPSFFKNPKIVIDLYDFDIARMIDKLDDNAGLNNVSYILLYLEKIESKII